MYKDEVKETKQQKREADIYIFKDFLLIYIQLLIYIPNEVEKRILFKKKFFEYIKHCQNENEILNYIKKHFGKVYKNDNVEDVMNEIEGMFINIYNSFQEMFLGYEEAIDLKMPYRAHLSKEPLIDENKKNELIKKLKVSN